MRKFCQRCEHEFIFDHESEDHFLNGICCHCQAEERWGSMQLVVRLRDKRTGLEKDYEQKVIRHGWDMQQEIDVTRYLWLEGNFGCDCNRSYCLYPGQKDKHLPCAGENVIEVLSIRLDELIIFEYVERSEALAYR